MYKSINFIILLVVSLFLMDKKMNKLVQILEFNLERFNMPLHSLFCGKINSLNLK